MQDLKQKIKNKKAIVGVIGLGYVGLPLALVFAKKGYKVIGIDIDKDRVNKIKKGISYITDISCAELKNVIKNKKFQATANTRLIKKLDAVIICVPTPLGKNRKPDISYIREAVTGVKDNIRKGQIVVLESTTYPGTTEEILVPILESTGLREGEDFYIAFSPERIDPGNRIYHTENTPKIIGGISPKSTEIARLLYSRVIKKVITVSSASAAEMVKLLENTFRIVNIALVNEIAMLCDKFDFDIWEIIDAAKTKPYGYMPFYPGPGVGGHCLDGGESVFVKHDGRFEMAQLADLTKELLEDPKNPKKTISGTTYIKPKKLEVASFNRFSRKGYFANVALMSMRNYSGNIIDITTNDKRNIKLTEKHPVFIYDNGTLKTKFAGDIQEEEQLPIALNISFGNFGNQPQRIDLINHLPEAQINKIRVRHMKMRWADLKLLIAKDIRENCRKYIDRYYEWFKTDTIPLLYFIDAERRGVIRVKRKDLLLHTGRGPSHSATRAVFEIDKDICRLIGYYLSEGCVTQDKSLRTRFVFNRDEKEYINDVLNILTKLGLKSSIYDSKIYKSTCIKVSNWLFAYLLRDILKCGKDSYSMRIPSEIFSASRECRHNLLAGLLRGDGGIDYSCGKREYRKNNKFYNHKFNSCVMNYFTINPTLFQQVVFLLQSFNMVPTFKKRENLLNLFGYKQLLKAKGFFLGEKLGKIKQYFRNSSKVLTNKTFKKFRNFATVKAANIKKYVASQPVYSMELASPDAIITSYGIVVHNCIPVDPLYLSWKAKERGFKTKFINLASLVNEAMPQHVTAKVEKMLARSKKKIKDSDILIIGIAYKKDIKDLRESPSLGLIKILQSKKAKLSYFDPYFPYLKINGINLDPVNMDRETLRKFDCAILVTDHTDLNYKFLAKNLKLILDTRNVFAKKGIKSKNIIKL